MFIYKFKTSKEAVLKRLQDVSQPDTLVKSFGTKRRFLVSLKGDKFSIRVNAKGLSGGSNILWTPIFNGVIIPVGDFTEIQGKFSFNWILKVGLIIVFGLYLIALYFGLIPRHEIVLSSLIIGGGMITTISLGFWYRSRYRCEIIELFEGFNAAG